MKLLRNLLFSQYYELKKKDRPVKSAKNTGLILSSVFIVLTIVALFMLLYTTGIFKGVYSPYSGKAMGRIGALLLFAISYGSMYVLYGKQDKFDALIASYEGLTIDEQESIYKKTMRQILTVFVVLMLIIILAAFFG
jgi:hypothetical protein